VDEPKEEEDISVQVQDAEIHNVLHSNGSAYDTSSHFSVVTSSFSQPRQ